MSKTPPCSQCGTGRLNTRMRFMSVEKHVLTSEGVQLTITMTSQPYLSCDRCTYEVAGLWMDVR